MNLPEQRPLIPLQGILKRFPGVLAVDDVYLDIYPDEVHVVAGENEAGKSTIMKLLSQVERPSKGTVLLNGQPIHFNGPRYAQSLGIVMVYQEFALAPHLSIAQNMSLGQEPMHLDMVNRKLEIRQARELLLRVGLEIDPRRLVSELSVAGQQMVEIAKALAIDAKLVIMDEPTAVLTGQEIEELLAVIRHLTSRGIAILYISHRLDEIFRIANRITVMRDGKVVATFPREEGDEKPAFYFLTNRRVSLMSKQKPKCLS